MIHTGLWTLMGNPLPCVWAAPEGELVIAHSSNDSLPVLN